MHGPRCIHHDIEVSTFTREIKGHSFGHFAFGEFYFRRRLLSRTAFSQEASLMGIFVYYFTETYGSHGPRPRIM